MALGRKDVENLRCEAEVTVLLILETPLILVERICLAGTVIQRVETADEIGGSNPWTVEYTELCGSTGVLGLPWIVVGKACNI